MRHTDYVILGLLSESPLTGYEIKKIIDTRFRFFWSESYGQLYPTLKSLKARGLIEESDEETEKKRSRKIYRIRQQGLDALLDWLGQPVVQESVRLEILLKLYFSHLVDAETMIRHLRIFQQAHERDLQILNLFAQELRSLSDQDPNHPYVLRVIDFGQKVNEAYLDWSRETIQFLESRVKK